MNPKNTGKAIATLRKQAGLTQASLAEKLGISDKAVSKWERGLACPDISLLPRLSMLLNIDIDDLFNGEISVRDFNWKGILFLNDISSNLVYSKPLVHYLIQNFMLVGIRDILVIGSDVEETLEVCRQFDIRIIYASSSSPDVLIQYPEFITSSTMIVYGNSLVYGANLTRIYQSMMLNRDVAVDLITDGKKQVPIIFCPKQVWKKNKQNIYKWNTIDNMLFDLQSVHKSLARGIVAIPMNDMEQILTASIFIQTIEKIEGKEVANLEEIAYNRGYKKIMEK